MDSPRPTGGGKPGWVNPETEYVINGYMKELRQCIEKGEHHKLRLLLDLGHDPNELGSSEDPLLFTLICNPQKSLTLKKLLQVVELLINYGAAVNVTNRKGETLLNKAVRTKKKRLVALLLEKGSDTEQKNRHGEKALFIACESDDFEMVELLLKHGADPDILHYCPNYYKQTMPDYSEEIFWVALWLNTSWLHVCLQNDIDVNIRDENGETLLFHALHNPGSVKLLLSNGVDPEVKNHKGLSVYQIAKDFLPSKWILLQHRENRRKAVARGGNING